jgi:hypothetical protein
MQRPFVNLWVICREFCSRMLAGLLLVLTFVLPLPARTRSTKHATPGVDPDYISALSTANRFLQAWQSHDQETGLLLLSDGAKHQTSPENLEHFFSATHGAYEITRGKRVKPNRYCFAVVLFDLEATGRLHPHYGELLVFKTGREDWAIDNLPAP